MTKQYNAGSLLYLFYSLFLYLIKSKFEIIIQNNLLKIDFIHRSNALLFLKFVFAAVHNKIKLLKLYYQLYQCKKKIRVTLNFSSYSPIADILDVIIKISLEDKIDVQQDVYVDKICYLVPGIWF